MIVRLQKLPIFLQHNRVHRNFVNRFLDPSIAQCLGKFHVLSNCGIGNDVIEPFCPICLNLADGEEALEDVFGSFDDLRDIGFDGGDNFTFDIWDINPHDPINYDVRDVSNDDQILLQMFHLILHQSDPIDSLKKDEHLFQVGSLHEIQFPFSKVSDILFHDLFLNFIADTLELLFEELKRPVLMQADWGLVNAPIDVFSLGKFLQITPNRAN